MELRIFYIILNALAFTVGVVNAYKHLGVGHKKQGFLYAFLAGWCVAVMVYNVDLMISNKD